MEKSTTLYVQQTAEAVKAIMTKEKIKDAKEMLKRVCKRVKCKCQGVWE